jgi:hypothetical protein
MPWSRRLIDARPDRLRVTRTSKSARRRLSAAFAFFVFPGFWRAVDYMATDLFWAAPKGATERPRRRATGYVTLYLLVLGALTALPRFPRTGK